MSTGRSHGGSGSGAMGHWMLAGLAASSTPPNMHTYTRREKAVFVLPKSGTGQARTTLTHPWAQALLGLGICGGT